MVERFRDFLGAWENWRVEAEDYRELDAGRGLVLLRVSARGKTSGLEVERAGASGANLFCIRGDKVTRFVIYWDRGQDLADLALAADTDAPPA
jgi:hypothetical protein